MATAEQVDERIKECRHRMNLALRRAEQESQNWEAARAAIKTAAAGDPGTERIMCKESLPLNDAFKACTFWQQHTMMYAAVLAAEVAFRERESRRVR